MIDSDMLTQIQMLFSYRGSSEFAVKPKGTTIHMKERM